MAKYLYIGAIWKGEYNGKPTRSGSIEMEKLEQAPRDAKGNVRFTIFENDRKTKDSQPDFKIAVKLDGGEVDTQGKGGQKDDDSDLPF